MRPGNTLSALLAIALIGCGASASSPRPNGAGDASTANKGSVAGVVLYASSRSAIGFATIVAQSSDGDTRSTVVSDSEGGYRFAQLEPGTYDIIAYYTDQNVQVTNVPVAANKTTQLDFEVEPTETASVVHDYRKPIDTLRTVRHASDVRGGIRGECIDLVSSLPLAGAVVTATNPDLRDAQITMCDDVGRFHLQHLPSGLYTLSVSYNLIGSGGYELRRSNVNVQRGETTEIKLILDTKTPD